LVRGPSLEDLASSDEQVAHSGNGEGVDHFAGFSTLMHQPVLAQDRQLMRQARCLDVYDGPELVDGFVAVGQQFKEADPGRVPERSEEVGLGTVEREGHSAPI